MYKRQVQTIQYQVITLMTTNGQAPFVTVFMYLDEVPEGQTRDDLKPVSYTHLISRINGFTYVKTDYDFYTSELKVVETKAFSDGERACLLYTSIQEESAEELCAKCDAFSSQISLAFGAPLAA